MRHLLNLNKLIRPLMKYSINLSSHRAKLELEEKLDEGQPRKEGLYSSCWGNHEIHWKDTWRGEERNLEGTM